MGEFDFLILGCGASAFAAAIKADELGARTVMVQGPLPIGGTCVNVGCVTSKALVHAAAVIHQARRNATPGVRLRLESIDFPAVIRAEQELVRKLRGKKYETVLEALPHVTLLEGAARFVDPHTVEVGKRRVGAERVLIAAGSIARPPAIPGLAEAGSLTHISALSLERLPTSLAVLGGGPVGLEFAQIFARFGSQVTLIVKDRRLFARTEPELSQALEAVFHDEGITILKNSRVERVEVRKGLKVLKVEGESGRGEVAVAEIIVATGKAPNTKDLDLHQTGVEVDGHGAVVVSTTLQTTVPHIFAAGDVVSLPKRLEPTAGREGTLAAENALNGATHALDYQSVPWAVFTDPQLAGVGLLDAEVGEHGLSCTCNTVSFDQVAKAHILGETRGLIKMVMDRKSRRIVGVHLLAESAGDLIGQAELVLKHRLTVDDLLATLPVLPTLSESLRIGALSLVTDISKLSCCV